MNDHDENTLTELGRCFRSEPSVPHQDPSLVQPEPQVGRLTRTEVIAKIRQGVRLNDLVRATEVGPERLRQVAQREGLIIKAVHRSPCHTMWLRRKHIPRPKPARLEVVFALIDVPTAAAVLELSQDQVQAIGTNLHAGQSLSATSYDLSIKRAKIDRIARRIGWTTEWLDRRKGQRKRMVGSMTRHEIITLTMTGMEVDVIAARAGVTCQYVNRIVRDVTKTGISAARPEQRPKPEQYADLLSVLDLPAVSTKLRLDVMEIDRILQDLHAGMNIREVSQARKVPEPHIRYLAAQIGWSSTWRSQSANRMVGAMQRCEIIPLFQAGMKLKEIAERAGVSTERIRQVTVMLKLPSRMETSQRLAQAKAAQKRVEHAIRSERSRNQREQRRTSQMQRFARANELWQQGVMIKDIAAIYGVTTNVMSWLIGNARKKWGPPWFAKRRPDSGRRSAAQQPGNQPSAAFTPPPPLPSSPPHPAHAGTTPAST